QQVEARLLVGFEPVFTNVRDLDQPLQARIELGVEAQVLGEALPIEAREGFAAFIARGKVPLHPSGAWPEGLDDRGFVERFPTTPEGVRAQAGLRRYEVV